MDERGEDLYLDAAAKFAQKPEEKALHVAWSAMNEAMLQAMTRIHAGEDQNGTLQVIANALDQGLEAIGTAEKALGLSFIPKKPEKPSEGQSGSESDEIPF
ncbi:hypothetical protein LC092_03365 [Stappia stellulata]|uniref:hypothetical protein n=1 Tax=Stappia stellulata TaxID=71235 RepID=UPI001CD77F96|nr:hypothetical protein [Stappia stellulata]MCA1241471.1 hypothetical protein [Stappia stellulata]